MTVCEAIEDTSVLAGELCSKGLLGSTDERVDALVLTLVRQLKDDQQHNPNTYMFPVSFLLAIAV